MEFHYNHLVEDVLGPSSLLAQISTLRFPPAQLQAVHFRDIFNRLSKVETFNYLIAGDGVELITPPRETGETIKISIGKDAVTVSFDPINRSVEFAAEQLVAIMKEIGAVLPIPVFVHQSHLLRKTIPLLGNTDARTFLLNEVVHIPPDRLTGWKRGFVSVGVRFVFPPQQANNLSSHELKIESFMHDPGKLLLENTSSFLIPLPAGQWDALKANLAEANKFLDDYAVTLIKGQPSPES